MSKTSTLYFVDDDPKAAELFQRFCRNTNIHVRPFRSPRAALEACKETLPDLLISDLKMPEMSGTDLMAEVRQLDPKLPIIIITGYSTVEDAVTALRLGATDFIKKPYDIEELRNQVEILLNNHQLAAENNQLKEALDVETFKPCIIGESPAIRALRQTIANLARVRCNVIIFGESGTGKELVASDLHRMSPQHSNPFTVIDCGALSDNLLESELFGYEKGAFTGADKRRMGKLEQSSGGSVFLDEIGNISDAMQTRLLRVIQEQEVTRVGSSSTVKIDVRFITASNRNLAEMAENQEFRHDLFHRLNVITIDVPPLRERGDDILLLARHFAHIFSLRYNQPAIEISHKLEQQLLHHSWPGNVRELKNTIERLSIIGELRLDSLSTCNTPPRPTEPSPAVIVATPDSIDADLPDLRTLERRYIQKILHINNDNREKTASILGINKTTLWRKLQQY